MELSAFIPFFKNGLFIILKKKPCSRDSRPPSRLSRAFSCLFILETVILLNTETERRKKEQHRYLLDVVQRVDLGRKAPVHAEELLVHQGGQGQAVKRLHAGVVNLLRVLDLTWRRSEDREKEGKSAKMCECRAKTPESSLQFVRLLCFSKNVLF